MSGRRRAQVFAELGDYEQLIRVRDASDVAEFCLVAFSGLFCLGASVALLTRPSPNLLEYGLAIIGLPFGLWMFGGGAWKHVPRLLGVGEPRLHCFVDGVVLAVGSQLTASRWEELRIEVERWNGAGGSWPRTVVFESTTGAVIVRSIGHGRGEHDAARLRRLHETALKRIADPAEPSDAV